MELVACRAAGRDDRVVDPSFLEKIFAPFFM
jgi:hypothetical protein